EAVRGALDPGGTRRWQTLVTLELSDGIHGLSEREAGREIERDRHRRLLSLVIDLQWAHGRFETCHRRQRNRRPGRCFKIYAREIVGAYAIVGLRLENDLIVIDRTVNCRHLPRTEGVVQLLANLIDRDAIDSRFFTIDLDRDLRIGNVEIRGDIKQPGNLRNLLAHFRRDAIERARVV